jgi:hypothetical protein
MHVRNVGKSLVVAAGLAVSLSACGMAQQQSPQSQAPQADSGSGNSSKSSDGSSSSSGSAPSKCDTGQMAASFELATTGSVDGHLKITNVGKKSCTLGAEYPSIQFTGREGTGIQGVNYAQGSKGSGAIMLKPGESANSDVEWQATANGSSSVSRVWALKLSVNPTDVAKSVEPTSNGQTGGQVFDLYGTNVTVGGWRKG